MAHDVVVVGGGTAGCVIAARLSEDSARSVLLVEAGPDFGPRASMPADLLDGRAICFNPAYAWGYASEPDRHGRSIPLWRGRLVGGGSAVNAGVALRGSPFDYDGWAAAGNPGWSFAEVLPVFRALERDLDFADEWHGASGPVPVRRPPEAEQTPLQRAFTLAAIARGHALVPDHNRPGAVGVGATPMNVLEGTRMSAALTHLGPARARPNLEIRPDSIVDRVAVRRGRAEGVLLAGGERLDAGLVVLAGGAYGSPAVLLRSGVGPAAALRALGVPVVADLGGVGEALADHPRLSVELPVCGPVDAGPRYGALLTMRSSLAPPGGGHDLHVFAAGPDASDRSPSGASCELVVSVVAPRARGRLTLRSADPAAAPRIETGHLRHADDVRRAVEGIVEARRLSREAPLAALLVGPELAPGAAISDRDEAALAARLRAQVRTYHHPAGTCRMGPDPGRGAVVDAQGRVHGVAGLVVGDAAILPDVPAANTNLPVTMVAERIAAWLTGAVIQP
jgi:choline dehydrogenase